MLDKRMIFAADFAGHFDRTRCGFLAVKEVSVIQLDFLDAVESPHKVQMPIAAAKFAVCDGVITSGFFLGDQLCDFLIFYLCQCFTGDFSGLEVLACLLEGCRTQKAADHIINKRNRFLAHDYMLLCLIFYGCSIRYFSPAVKYQTGAVCYRISLYLGFIRRGIVPEKLDVMPAEGAERCALVRDVTDFHIFIDIQRNRNDVFAVELFVDDAAANRVAV